MASSNEYYPTDEAVRRYRAAALRKTGRRISADEARVHLLRWRRFVWEHRPIDCARECA